jgi:hypothetical protein
VRKNVIVEGLLAAGVCGEHRTRNRKRRCGDRERRDFAALTETDAIRTIFSGWTQGRKGANRKSGAGPAHSKVTAEGLGSVADVRVGAREIEKTPAGSRRYRELANVDYRIDIGGW